MSLLFGRMCAVGILLVLITSSMYGQKTFEIQVVQEDASQPIVERLLRDDGEVTDSLSVYRRCRQWVKRLHGESYLSASVDTIVFDGDTARIHLHIGPPFHVETLAVDSADADVLQAVGFERAFWSNRRLDPTDVANLLDRMVTYLENHGYPFAQVGLEESRLVDGRLSASIDVQRNRFIRIDSMHLTGDLQLSEKYLERYLELPVGSPYDHNRILDVRRKIRQLPFARLRQDPTVTFYDQQAVLNLDLNNQNASRFDFLFGLLPGTTDGERSLTIAVEFTADMVNKLGLGERMFAEFKQLRPNVQELELAVNYPFVLDMPFGIDGRFELFRNERSFIELDADIGLQYLFGGTNYLKGFWNINSSRLLDIDTTAILNGRRLPGDLDVRYTAGGLELHMETLDYRFNPKRGYALTARGSAGFNKTLPNSNILELRDEFVDFTNSYDSLELSTFQFRIEGRFDVFWPVGSRSVIHQGWVGGLIVNEAQTFRNELYRIGGNKLLRGFDEESILTNFYHVFTTEFRLLLSENSFLTLPFIDVAVVQNKLLLEDPWDVPVGIGAGINFETKAGIFALSVAVGRQRGNPFDFGASKAHFGYVNLF